MIKQNRRTWLSLMLAFMLIVTAFAGCGPSENTKDGNNQTPADSETEKEITFWNFFTGPDGETMAKLIDGFNETSPDYKIKPVTIASGDLYAKIPSVVNSGEGIPDLTMVDVSRVASFKQQELLEPMDGIMGYAPEIKAENYNALVWDSGTIDGSQYAVPLDIGAIGLVYNVDLVKKYCPNVLDDGVVTVDEIKAAIPAASKDGIVTYGKYYFDNDMAQSLASQEGWELFTDEKTPDINSPEMIKAVNEIKEIIDMGGSTQEGDEVFQIFLSGKMIFLPTGIWDANSLNAAENLKWGVTSALCYTPDKLATYGNSNQFVLLKNDARSDEKEKVIAKFLDYVRENAIVWAGSGMVPASNAANDDPEYKAMKQYVFVSTPEMQNSLHFRSYTYAGYAGDSIGAVLGEILYGRMSIEDGLAQAQQETIDNIAQNENE